MTKDRLLVTPALLTGSPNPYVQTQESRDWMIRVDSLESDTSEDENRRQRESKLCKLLVDVLRGGLRYRSHSSEIKEFSASDLQKRFTQSDVDDFSLFLEDEVGFTKEQIKRLDAGYSQQLISIAIKLLECGSNGLKGDPQRAFSSGGFKMNFSETEERELLIQTQFSFHYRQMGEPAGKLLKTLPPITMTCAFTDAAKAQGAAEFVYADVPLLYSPLLFSNEDFDFVHWYEYLTSEVATFVETHPLRVPEVLLGANQQMVPLDIGDQDFDSPISDDEALQLRQAFRKGRLRFAGLVTSEFPEGVGTDSALGKQLYNSYFSNFYKTLPKRLTKNTESMLKLDKAIQRQWLALSEKHKNTDITIAYDPVKTAVFRVAEPYQFSEANTEDGVVIERIRRTFDVQAADLLKVAEPESEVFRAETHSHASDKPNGIQLVVSLNKPTGELAPNTVYAYPTEGSLYEAFYIDPTGKQHKSIEIEDQNDQLLSPISATRDKKATDTRLLEQATYQYRVAQFHQAYLVTAEQVRRRTTVNAVMATLEPLMGTVGYGRATFGIYTIDEIPRSGDRLSKPYSAVQGIRNCISYFDGFHSNSSNSEQITEQEWAQFINQLGEIYPAYWNDLRANLPEPKSGKHNRKAIGGLVDAIKEQAENALRDEYQNTPLGRVNQRAIAKAWYDDPADPAVLAPITKQDQQVLADPRLILLSTQATHISDNAYLDWEDAYGLLATAGYKGLDDLRADLQEYRQNVFMFPNAKRQKAVVNLLKSAQRELNNTHLPDFIRLNGSRLALNIAPLAVLERELVHEISYLQEMQQLRKEVENEEVGDYKITDVRRVRPNQPQSPNPLQQAIFKSFKDANRRLPTREQLAQYAKQVGDTETALAQVEKNVLTYLTSSKGIKIADSQGETSRANFIWLQRLTKDQRHDRKVYQAVLVLGLIDQFRERHGNAFPGNNDAPLVDIEDYSAILSALHAILKRNNDKDHWYNWTNRFGVVVKAALGAKPAKTLAFAPELALRLADYEKTLYEKHQEDRFFLFKKEFKEDEAVLRPTAPNEAVIDSGRYIEKAQAVITDAQTIEELEKAEEACLLALRDSGRFQHAFVQKPMKRGVMKEFLVFTVELQELYINACCECDTTFSVKSLEASSTRFTEALAVVLDKYTNTFPVKTSEEVRRTYVTNLQAVQKEFDVKYRVTKGIFEQARMEYWRQLMSTVTSVVDGVGKDAHVVNITHRYDDAKKVIEEVTLSKEDFRLATDHQEEVYEQVIKMITTVKDDRLKILLKEKARSYLEGEELPEGEKLPVIQEQVSLDRLHYWAVTAGGAIGNLVSSSGLSKEDGEAVVAEYRETLEEVRRAQENFIKSKPEFEKLYEKYHRQVEENPVSKLPAVLLEAAEAIEAMPVAKAHQEKVFQDMADNLKSKLVIPAIKRYIDARQPVITEAMRAFEKASRFDPSVNERSAEASYCDAVKETLTTIRQMVPEGMQIEEISRYQLEQMVLITREALDTMIPVWGMETARKQLVIVTDSGVKNALRAETTEKALKEGFKQFERGEKYATLRDALEARIKILVAIRAGSPQDTRGEITKKINCLEDLAYLGEDELINRLGEIPEEVRTAAVGLYDYRMEQFIEQTFDEMREDRMLLLQEKVKVVSREFDVEPQLPSNLIAALQVRLLREEYAPLIHNALCDYQLAKVKDSAELALRKVVVDLAEAINIYASENLDVEAIRELTAEKLEVVAKVLTDIHKDFPSSKQLLSLDAAVLADELFETLLRGKYIKQTCTEAISEIQRRLETIFSQEKKPAVDEVVVPKVSDERAQQIDTLVNKLNQFVDGKLRAQDTARNTAWRAMAAPGVIHPKVEGRAELAYYEKAVSRLAASLKKTGVKKEDIPENIMKKFLYGVLSNQILQMATDFAKGELSYKALEAKIDEQLKIHFFEVPTSKPAKTVREYALERVLSFAYWGKVQHRPEDQKGKHTEMAANQLDQWIAARFNDTADYHKLKSAIRTYLTENNFNHLSMAKRDELVNSTLTTIDEMVFRIYTQLYSLVEQRAVIQERVEGGNRDTAETSKLERLRTLNVSSYNDKIQQVIKLHPGIEPRKDVYVVGKSAEGLAALAQDLRGISGQKRAGTVKKGQQAISRKDAMVAEAKESIAEAIFEMNPVREESKTEKKNSLKLFGQEPRSSEDDLIDVLPFDWSPVGEVSKRRNSAQLSDFSSEGGKINVADQKKRDDKLPKLSTYSGSILVGGNEEKGRRPFLPEDHKVRFVEPGH